MGEVWLPDGGDIEFRLDHSVLEYGDIVLRIAHNHYIDVAAYAMAKEQDWLRWKKFGRPQSVMAFHEIPQRKPDSHVYYEKYVEDEDVGGPLAE